MRSFRRFSASVVLVIALVCAGSAVAEATSKPIDQQSCKELALTMQRIAQDLERSALSGAEDKAAVRDAGRLNDRIRGLGGCLGRQAINPSDRNPKRHLQITPIDGTLFQSLFLTEYGVHWRRADGAVTTEWTLRLERVDPKGASDPDTTGSSAAVDVGCDNNGDGLPNHPDRTVSAETKPEGFGRFDWYHPDPMDSKPVGRYHCNHTDQGPRGHQGLITVKVSDALWTCTASFKGTKTNVAPAAYAFGTATHPRCRKR